MITLRGMKNLKKCYKKYIQSSNKSLFNRRKKKSFDISKISCIDYDDDFIIVNFGINTKLYNCKTGEFQLFRNIVRNDTTLVSALCYGRNFVKLGKKSFAFLHGSHNVQRYDLGLNDTVPPVSAYLYKVKESGTYNYVHVSTSTTFPLIKKFYDNSFLFTKRTFFNRNADIKFIAHNTNGKQMFFNIELNAAPQNNNECLGFVSDENYLYKSSLENNILAHNSTMHVINFCSVRISEKKHGVCVFLFGEFAKEKNMHNQSDSNISNSVSGRFKIYSLPLFQEKSSAKKPKSLSSRRSYAKKFLPQKCIKQSQIYYPVISNDVQMKLMPMKHSNNVLIIEDMKISFYNYSAFASGKKNIGMICEKAANKANKECFQVYELSRSTIAVITFNKNANVTDISLYKIENNANRMKVGRSLEILEKKKNSIEHYAERFLYLLTLKQQALRMNIRDVDTGDTATESQSNAFNANLNLDF